MLNVYFHILLTLTVCVVMSLRLFTIVVDFINNISGVEAPVEQKGGFDMKALRAFRVLRPLRLVSGVPSESSSPASSHFCLMGFSFKCNGSSRPAGCDELHS